MWTLSDKRAYDLFHEKTSKNMHLVMAGDGKFGTKDYEIWYNTLTRTLVAKVNDKHYFYARPQDIAMTLFEYPGIDDKTETQ